MIRKIILVLFGLYLILLLGFYFLQEHIIFQAKKLELDYSFSFSGDFEEINLKAEDGALINALHFKVKNPKGVLLFFHGNRGNLDRWGKLVLPFSKYQYDVFVIDYRGYGKSNGKRVEKEMYKDAQVAYEYLKKQFTEEKIVIYGRSLGCTFATYVASKNSPKGLILEAPFYNLSDVLKSHFLLLPYSYLLRYQFNTNELINNVNVPTVIFHGSEDKLVSIKSAQKLFKLSNKNQVQFIILDGGTHHNLASFDKYQNTIASILK